MINDCCQNSALALLADLPQPCTQWHGPSSIHNTYETTFWQREDGREYSEIFIGTMINWIFLSITCTITAAPTSIQYFRRVPQFRIHPLLLNIPRWSSNKVVLMSNRFKLQILLVPFTCLDLPFPWGLWPTKPTKCPFLWHTDDLWISLLLLIPGWYSIFINRDMPRDEFLFQLSEWISRGILPL